MQTLNGLLTLKSSTIKIDANGEKTYFFIKHFVISEKSDYHKMIEEKSGVIELIFKILPFVKLKYSKIVILASLDAQ